MKTTRWMVGSYTTGLTMYADTREEALELVHNSEYYDEDDRYVFIEKQVLTDVHSNVWHPVEF